MRPWALVAFLLALLPSVLQAQEPARRRELVYSLIVSDGGAYNTTFAPASAEVIYVFAESDVALAPSTTEVYFWPLTSDWRADFGALNEPTDGMLEVARDGAIVAQLPLVDVILQIDPMRGWEGGRLFVGPDAVEARRAFEQERQGYLDRLREYGVVAEAHIRQADEARRLAPPGQAVAIPPAPQPPAPMSLYSGEIARSFHVRLSAGEYNIRVRAANGATIVGSERRLVAIAPRRYGVVYEVVPQEKWTMPERADDPANVLYVLPGGVVYLRPFGAHELNEREHARLRNPQELSGSANRWTWVRTAPATTLPLRVDAGLVEQGSFSVRQLPGAALGYTIVPHAGPEAPDLVAFRVDAPGARGGRSIAVTDSGVLELPGSRRELRAVAPIADWQLALPVLVPIGVGATVALWRRERVVTIGRLPRERRHLVA